MTGYTRSPKLLKGALVSIRIPNPLPNVIAFQFNPEQVQRTLEAREAEGAGEGSAETFRLAGAPKETIKVDVVLDATDGLETGESSMTENGLHARLAALETLIYPLSSTVIANTILLNAGTVQVIAEQGPFTIFIWGKNRILPVKLSGLTVAEEQFDPNLNPTRAKVTLDMKVLTYSDLTQTHPGYAMYLSHQILKEAFGLVGQARGLASVLGSDVSLL